MGKRLDDAMGKIIATLKAEGIWENTLLFFISDNGGPLAQSADNTPLRGGKHTDYEGGIRVPFLACWPGSTETPGECQVAVVISLDILPTALAASRRSRPIRQDHSMAKTFCPFLRGKATPAAQSLFWCSASEEGWWAVRSGDWKLVGEKGAHCQPVRS
jgi:arylsulfatase A-like enzyme